MIILKERIERSIADIFFYIYGGFNLVLYSLIRYFSPTADNRRSKLLSPQNHQLQINPHKW